MIRVTTNSTLYNYRYNLGQNTNSLNNSMMKVMTQRNFSSYASNPAAATRAFKVHSALNATRAQYSNNQTVTSKFETAWSTIRGISDDLTEDMGQVPALEGLSTPNLDTLDIQAQVLRSGAEAIVQSMNGKYDQDFIFAGSDNQNAPFAIEDGHITYRGVAIDDPDTLNQVYRDPETNKPIYKTDANGDPVLDDSGQPVEMTNAEVLKMWAEDDPLYVDIGLGFELDEDGKVIDSTAFDASISGIAILGYGIDEDGDPKNLASIMLRLADIFDGYDASNKEDPWGGNEEEANRLINKFKESKEAMIDAHAELDAKTGFLNSNGTQLESTFDALNTERSSIEDVDMVDAITELVWAQTCYNAALQVGTNVIPQSLMDYLK